MNDWRLSVFWRKTLFLFGLRFVDKQEVKSKFQRKPLFNFEKKVDQTIKNHIHVNRAIGFPIENAILIESTSGNEPGLKSVYSIWEFTWSSVCNRKPRWFFGGSSSSHALQLFVCKKPVDRWCVKITYRIIFIPLANSWCLGDLSHTWWKTIVYAQIEL